MKKNKKLYPLPWVLTIKYRPDGSTYFDKTVNHDIRASLNNDFLDLKKLEYSDDIEIQYKICEVELEETLQFFEEDTWELFEKINL